MNIVLASNNNEKLRELQAILSDCKITIIAQQQLNIPEVLETGTSFVENALIKARNAAKYTNFPVIADDSGLEVDALNGAPGIYSARYAGVNATYSDNIAKLLYEMRDVPDQKRTARFHCAIVYLPAIATLTPIICQGTMAGSILFCPRGHNGFGYDPIFFVPEYNYAIAELDADLKNKISHRALALAKFKNVIRKLKYETFNT
jgi:XTP/dITP diphosphohydrolase